MRPSAASAFVMRPCGAPALGGAAEGRANVLEQRASERQDTQGQSFQVKTLTDRLSPCRGGWPVERSVRRTWAPAMLSGALIGLEQAEGR